MSRNGRKWTIGYRTKIKLGDKEINFEFDAITDEGDGPTYYTTNSTQPTGKREFISKLLNTLKRAAES